MDDPCPDSVLRRVPRGVLMLPYYNLKMNTKGILYSCIDEHEGNVVLLHFLLVEDSQDRLYPWLLASKTSKSEPFGGEYPQSHMYSELMLIQLSELRIQFKCYL